MRLQVTLVALSTTRGRRIIIGLNDQRMQIRRANCFAAHFASA